MKDNVMVESTGPGQLLTPEDGGKRAVKENFKKTRLGEWQNGSAMKRIRGIMRKTDV